MKDKIESELNKLKDNFIVLTILPNKDYENINLHLLNVLMNKKKFKGGYISINRPFQSLSLLLNKNKININDLFFIDCVTGEVNRQKRINNCVFIGTASNLTEISIAADKILKDKERKFIFLDSLDTLTVYNSEDSVIKFIHFLINKMRMYNTSGVILSLHEGTNQKMLDELAQFCDKIIDLR